MKESTNLETELRHRKFQQEGMEEIKSVKEGDGEEVEAKLGIAVVEETPTLVHSVQVGLAVVAMLQRARAKTKGPRVMVAAMVVVVATMEERLLESSSRAEEVWRGEWGGKTLVLDSRKEDMLVQLPVQARGRSVQYMYMYPTTTRQMDGKDKNEAEEGVVMERVALIILEKKNVPNRIRSRYVCSVRAR